MAYELSGTVLAHVLDSVLLTQEAEFQQWLNGTPREAYSLVKQDPPEKMRIVQSGSDKKDLLAA